MYAGRRRARPAPTWSRSGRRRLIWRALVVALALSVLLGACAGDDDAPEDAATIEDATAQEREPEDAATTDDATAQEREPEDAATTDDATAQDEAAADASRPDQRSEGDDPRTTTGDAQDGQDVSPADESGDASGDEPTEPVPPAWRPPTEVEVLGADVGAGLSQPLANAPLPDGYVERELTFAGEAVGYESAGELSGDGFWEAIEASSAPYRTRMIVRRPADVADFSGVVLVEWFNVTAGTDTSPDWGYLHEEIGRSGHAYVGVSVQAVGVNGSDGGLIGGGLVDTSGLIARDPDRYGDLEHPGDGFAFDIFSQAGAALSGSSADVVLGELTPDHVIAMGESQSAIFLTTYVNAIHPLVRGYDGFLVHSRGSSAPDPSGARSGPDDPVQIRTDLDAPVLQFEAETDLTVLNFRAARQDDSETVRTWEVAGTAHADTYSLAVSAGLPRDAELGGLIGCSTPINDGPHHETLQAAVANLVDWVADGTPPPVSPRIEIADDGSIARDDLGIAVGGIRTPPVDAPLRVLSGDPSDESGACVLFGQTVSLESSVLEELHGDAAGFAAALEQSAAAAVDAGFLLAADAETIIADETARAVELGLG